MCCMLLPTTAHHLQKLPDPDYYLAIWSNIEVQAKNIKNIVENIKADPKAADLHTFP